MSGGAAYQAALYMRLSKDDEGTGESASIVNQRNMLTAYAGEHGYDVVGEYVDDGYSGTSFDRPGFRRMLADIEAHKINLVLTKDLSRLGRDYIQTGQYTEVYFPAHKVRCIAVNDGFDTESPYTDIAPFKNVVNEMYARDASKKIRSAFVVKRQNGCYIGNFAPYGYQKDPEDKNHLIPDEVSAAMVREIFDLAAGGYKPGEIARLFNGRGVLPPALYRCAQHPQLDAKAYSKRGEWTAATLTKMLHNVVYLGHMAQGKSAKVSFKSKLVLRNPPSDWVVVKHTHQPLVTQECFDMVQSRLQSRRCEAHGGFTNIFSGIAKCADCGRNMSAVGTRKKGSPANLACGGYKLYGSGACSNHFIDFNALYAIVLDALRRRLALTEGERAKLRLGLRAEIDGLYFRQLDETAALGEEQARVERLIEQLYEDRLNEKIETERFYRLLQKYEKRSETLREKISAGQAADADGGGNDRKERAFRRLDELTARCGDIPALDEDLLFEFIDRIEVGQGRYEQTAQGKIRRQDIVIVFKFQTETGTMEYCP